MGTYRNDADGSFGERLLACRTPASVPAVGTPNFTGRPDAALERLKEQGPEVSPRASAAPFRKDL